MDLDRIKYTKTHEWIEFEIIHGAKPSEKRAIGTVGITERGQLECGEIAYVVLPDEGEEYEQEEPVCNLELINGDIYTIHAPVTGEILEVNKALEDDPNLVSQAPEDDGWIFKMSIEVPRELSLLMDFEEYESFDGEDEYEYYDYYDDE